MMNYRHEYNKQRKIVEDLKLELHEKQKLINNLLVKIHEMGEENKIKI